MKLCPVCHALMWGENCTNAKCEQHYNSDNRVLAEMFSKSVTSADGGEGCATVEGVAV